MIYKGNHCRLRPADTQDTDLILSWENDVRTMIEDGRSERYEREDIESMLAAQENSSLQENGQYRYMVETSAGDPVGMIDLFNYRDSMCEVGIMIFGPNRRHSYARGALHNLEHVAEDLGLIGMMARIKVTNTASRRLFARCGYRFMCIHDGLLIYTLTI